LNHHLVDIPNAKPSKSIGIEGYDPMGVAGRKILLFQFTRMLAHEDGTKLGEDIEELHDMRVATRRMRAAFRVFKDYFEKKDYKKYMKGLRATGRALGRVRDLDVFMEKANDYLENQTPEDRNGLELLISTWMKEREVARTNMLFYLDSEENEIFKREFNIFLQTPDELWRSPEHGYPRPHLVRELAPILIYTRLAAVRAFESILDGATIPQLHNLRIEFKKLRYTVEYFREVLSPEAKEVISDIKHLQDHLGDLNDANVACLIISELLDNSEQSITSLPQNGEKEPIIAYLAYKKAERERLIATFPEAWCIFTRPEFRSNLAKVVSVL
jgi:CHAD domain-containing protein